MRTFIKSLLGLALFASATPLFAASTPAKPPATPAPVPPQAILLADVNIQNCSMVQKGETLSIACDFINNGSIQSDIKYSVQLLKKVGDRQALVEEKVYPEVLALATGQTLHKTISYTIPPYADGDLQVWVRASNSEGLLLSLNQVGTISHVQKKSGVYILGCFLTVKGDTAGTKYTTTFGVDIAATESLMAQCDVQNLGTSPITLTPSFENHRRNIFGDRVELTAPQNEPLTLAAGETKRYAFSLPKPTVPQAYDAEVMLVNGATSESNTISLHYVIQGTSGTIQDVSIDKTSYAAGDTAIVSAAWSGSADDFPHSRASGSGNSIKSVSTSIMSHGSLCGEATQDAKSSTMGVSTKISVPITRTCKDPSITVKVLGADGSVIALKTIEIPSSLGKASFWETKVFWPIVILLAGIGGVIITLLLRRKRRSSIPPPPLDLGGPGSKVLIPMILLPLLIGSLFFLGGAPQAEAATYLDISGVTYTVNLNKSTYSPGENIAVAMNVTWTGCSNSGPGLYLDVTNTPIPSQNFHLETDPWFCWECDAGGGGLLFTYNYNYTANFTAPSPPVTTTYYVHAVAGSGPFDIPYTVVLPNSPPTINITGPSTCATNQSCSFDFNASDPDGNQLLIGVDWDNNGSVDQGNPGGIAGNNPYTLSTTHSWSAPGTYTFQAYALDANGASSGWVSKTIRVLAAPTVTISANPNPVAYNSAATLTWTSTNATSCSAGGGWSGSKTLNGSEATGNLTSATTYDIWCNGPGGTTPASITVGVGAAPQPDLTASLVAGHENITVTAGQPVTLDALVSNIGAGATGAPFTTAFWTNTSQSWSGATYTAFTSGAPSGFPPNYSEVDGPQLPVTRTFNTPGTYYYQVCANRDSANNESVAQSNPGNDCTVWGTITVNPIPLPDLSVSTAPSGSSSFITNAATSYAGIVSNTGNATGSNYPNVLQVLNAGGTSTIARYAAAPATVTTAAGNTSVVTGTIPANALPAGNYKVRFCANMNLSGAFIITEGAPGYYGNNCGLTKDITVGPVPDTLSGSCSVSPSTIAPSGSATWTATAAGGTAPYTYAWVTDGGSPASGSGKNHTAQYLTAGSYSGSVTITDSDGATTGSVACSTGLTVSAPDISVTAAPVGGPSSFAEDVGVTWDGTITNIGNGIAANYPNVIQVLDAAGTTNIARYAASPATITTAASASTGVTATIPANALTPGTYQIRFCGNMNTSGTMIIAEDAPGYYGNNCGSATTITVTASGPAPAPTCDLTATPPDAVPSTLTWTSTNATSCTGSGFNTGGAPSGSVSVSTAGNYALTCTGSGGTCNSGATIAACPGTPSGTITGTPMRVRTGSTATVSVGQVSGVKTSCVVTNLTTGAVITTLQSNSCNVSGTSFNTGPITEQTTYVLSCDGSEVNRTTINIIPNFTEF